MNVKEYAASGILEDYCLGMLDEQEAQEVEQIAQLHPEIQKSIDENFRALEEYALGWERQPPEGTREKILGLIDNLGKEEEALPDNLPLINRFSSSKKWLAIVKPLLPVSTENDIYAKVLTNSGGIFQSVLWLKSYYPDEVHGDVQESALVLEGECTCYIGEDVITLGPGNYLEIPLHAHHNIKVTNGPVLAIVQRLKAV